MSGPRDELELELPFYVNGTLDAETRAELEALAAEDPELRAEIEALGAIRAEMQAEEVRAPGEFGVARLMRDIDRETVDAAQEGTVVPLRAPSRGWLWQLAAAVAVVGLIAQGFLLRQPAAPEGYVMAGAGAEGALVVGFVPEASEAQIRALLLAQGLEIVAGPSALGLYRLDVTADADAGTAAAALRAAGDIVESVENVEH